LHEIDVASTETCVDGRDGLCAKQSASGFFHPGTFQQYVTAPARYLTPIPENLSSSAAAPMLCAGLTAYAALRKARTRPGNWAVVSGAGGGLGHLVLQLASRVFGLRVIGIDQATKKSLVMENSAETFVDVAKPSEELAMEVKNLTGGLGPHVVFVCAASNAAYAQGVEMLRPGGTLVAVGMPGGEPVPIASAKPGIIVQKELKIVGSILGNRQDAVDVLDLAARNVITLHHEVKPLQGLTQVSCSTSPPLVFR